MNSDLFESGSGIETRRAPWPAPDQSRLVDSPRNAQSIDDYRRYYHIATELRFQELLDHGRTFREGAKEALQRIVDRARSLTPYSYEWSMLQLIGQSHFEGFDLNEALKDPTRKYEWRHPSKWDELPETADRRALAVVLNRGESLRYDERAFQTMDPAMLASILSGRHPLAAAPPIQMAPLAESAAAGSPDAPALAPAPAQAPRLKRGLGVAASAPSVRATGRAARVATDQLIADLVTYNAELDESNFALTAAPDSPVADYWAPANQTLRSQVVNPLPFNTGYAQLRSLRDSRTNATRVSYDLSDRADGAAPDFQTARQRAVETYGGIAFAERNVRDPQAKRFVSDYARTYQAARSESDPQGPPETRFVALPSLIELRGQSSEIDQWKPYVQAFHRYMSVSMANIAASLAAQGYQLEFRALETSTRLVSGAQITLYTLYPVMVRRRADGSEDLFAFVMRHDTGASQNPNQYSAYGFTLTKEAVTSGNGALAGLLQFFGIEPNRLTQTDPFKRTQQAAQLINELLARQRENGRYAVLPIVAPSVLSIDVAYAGGSGQ